MKQSTKKSSIEESLIEIGEALSRNNIFYCIIGALADGIYGEVRATRDVDFLILVSQKEKKKLLNQLKKKKFQVDLGWSKYNPLIRSVQTRLVYKEKTIIDLMEPRNNFDKQVILKRKKKKMFGKDFYFPAPEDLILMKLKVGRPRDFEDALSVLIRQKKIDEKYLFKTAQSIGVYEEIQYIFNKKPE